MKATKCIDCGTEKETIRLTGSFQCEPCKSNLIERINGNYRNIDVPNEERLEFLMRRAKELGINKTEKDIKKMIFNGYEDWQILSNEKIHVWTWGNGSAQRVPFPFE